MVRENIINIKGRISLICAKINRDPAQISIVAVSKGRTTMQIQEAIKAGIYNIGENRVQESLSKYHELYASAIRQRIMEDGGSAKNFGGKRYTLNAIKWHMVGHLQTNKVKNAVKIFDLIQSVDSLRLTQEIDKEAAKINKIQNILIEVNPVTNTESINEENKICNGVKTSGEATKFGIKPDEAIEVIKEIAKFKNINLNGLMTIAPIVDNPDKARPYFRMLRELRDKINALSTVHYPLSTLSMGMTDDFEVAIEEGSNMVRLGRAIFEN